MRTRPLGKTGYLVSEIGFGAWAIGGSMWGGPDDQRSLAALGRALDLGVCFFDTAAAYGNGHSERLLGRVLRERRFADALGRSCVLATKVPPKDGRWPAAAGSNSRAVFPAGHLRDHCERSLRNLGVERIDVLMLHVWSDCWADQDEWYDEMLRLRRDGKIAVIAASLNDHQPETGLRAIVSGRLEAVQVIHNLFDQSAEDVLLPACAAHGVGVIARCPFDEGSLTGKLSAETRFPAGDFRGRYFRGERLAETVRRVEELRFLARPGRTLAQAALRYVLDREQVSTVIPGMRTPAQVEENVAAAELERLSDDERARLREHRWLRNFYG
jgi:aryl-alcohol dehydrogenase-like predicted oxidoreductase